MHSTNVTHFCRPGFAWNCWRIWASIMHLIASIFPIANPLSFILYIFSNMILYSTIICYKSWNHWVNLFEDMFLTLTASIKRGMTLVNSKYRCKNLLIHCLSIDSYMIHWIPLSLIYLMHHFLISFVISRKVEYREEYSMMIRHVIRYSLY